MISPYMETFKEQWLQILWHVICVLEQNAKVCPAMLTLIYV